MSKRKEIEVPADLLIVAGLGGLFALCSEGYFNKDTPDLASPAAVVQPIDAPIVAPELP